MVCVRVLFCSLLVLYCVHVIENWMNFHWISVVYSLGYWIGGVFVTNGEDAWCTKSIVATNIRARSFQNVLREWRRSHVRTYKCFQVICFVSMIALLICLLYSSLYKHYDWEREHKEAKIFYRYFLLITIHLWRKCFYKCFFCSAVSSVGQFIQSTYGWDAALIVRNSPVKSRLYVHLIREMFLIFSKRYLPLFFCILFFIGFSF
jgi:hypothetical protein